MTALSYSSIRTLRQCEQSWAYQYVHGLRSAKGDSGPALAGSWMHALQAADSIARGRALGSLITEPDRIRIGDIGPVIAVRGYEVTASSVLEVCAQWWPTVQEAYPDTAVALQDALGGPPPAALAALWSRYQARWAPQTAKERPLLVEASWRRQIQGSTVEVPGRLDEVYFDEARGITVCRDHKWSGAFSPNNDDRLFDLTGVQLHLTAWGIAPTLVEGGRSKPVAVEYNRALFVAPSTPQLTKGTKTKDGEWKTRPRLSKTVTRFDLATYQAFCLSDEAIEVEYAAEPELIEKLTAAQTGEDWFKRTLRPVNLTVVNRHLVTVVGAAERSEVISADPSSAVASPGDNCRWCDYAPLCLDEFYGARSDPLIPSDYGLKLRSTKNGATTP